jgi:oxygen-independent coproporphyrinogen-3 oxidase
MGVLGLERLKARSILIGGGTPTYLTPAQLKRFLDSFVRRVDLSRCQQFNYDVDPTTLLGPDGRERLRIMRDYGVDRLTIGVQSLQDQTLKTMNRHHTAQAALDSISAARELGYQLNIEFIFGYPGQTMDHWITDIEQAMTLDVDEIQLYRLKVDAYGDFQGPIKTLISNNTLRVLTDEETLLMKKVAIDMLTRSGFSENIRRVFCRTKKHFSRYAWNQCCMMYDELGFGLTAFSSLRDRFGLNTQHFTEYYDLINGGKLPLNRGLVRTPEEQQRWGIILPLKNSHIMKKLYQQRTGTRVDTLFREKMQRLKNYGLILEDDANIALTSLGAFFADEVVQQFHHPAYIPFPREAYADGELNPYNHQTP